MLGNEFSIKIGQADIDSWDSVGDVIHTFVEKVEE
jgi:acyl carrier protein